MERVSLKKYKGVRNRKSENSAVGGNTKFMILLIKSMASSHMREWGVGASSVSQRGEVETKLCQDLRRHVAWVARYVAIASGGPIAVVFFFWVGLGFFFLRLLSPKYWIFTS
ncbi:hypothetical protein ACLOJK_002098 [Asimina triloba]